MSPTPSTAAGAVQPLVLELDRVRLRVDHRKGAGIVDAHWRGTDGAWLPVIGRNVPGEDPVANHASFVMAPWCNRVRDAVFSWGGRRIALRPDPRDGTAMHGDVRKRAFELLDRSPVSARLKLDSRAFGDVNFPWPFSLETRFEVGESWITQEVTLTNIGDEAFPCGVGLHPYFPRTQAGEPVGARVIAPVGARFPSDRCMPIGPARRDARCRWLSSPRGLPSHYFMDSFTGYQNACVVEWARSRLTMTSSENHNHMVFFAPTKANGAVEPFFAVEPMTISADGFNLPAREGGLTALKPGGSLKTWYRFEVEDR
jgi:aldose 1-epimerase